ncbi:MAG: hypothetical protein DYH13_10325 [Alphaproteobacteria bacterium PRO2]|nr:hypothetical protein [Alphaproteobacteria bacterium PRO2]
MTLPTLPDPKQAEAEARHTLTQLSDELRELTMTEDISLARQAQLLEYAFAFLLREGLHAKWDANGTLRLALQSQRQCVDTLRAETSRRYMESFMSGKPNITTIPLPGKTPK